MIPLNPTLAVVGATGAVGTTLLDLIHERHFPYARVDAVASARSAGSRVPFGDDFLTVTALEDYDFGDVDIAFFSAGTSVSREWAPVAAAAGALVIDNTNAFRMDPESFLVVPQVNGHLLRERPASGIIGNPNCSTIPLVRVLNALRGRWPLHKVVVSTYQAASGQGLHGLAELKEATESVLREEPVDRWSASRFPRSLAFDSLPLIDVPLDSGFTLEEQKMTQESARILDDPTVRVTATCVRVPVLNCHAETAYLESSTPFVLDEVLDALDEAEEVVVHRDMKDFPSQATITDLDSVHVGRVRTAVDDPGGLWMWIVADNIRVGAALNAIQIAERLPVGAFA